MKMFIRAKSTLKRYTACLIPHSKKLKSDALQNYELANLPVEQAEKRADGECNN